MPRKRSKKTTEVDFIPGIYNYCDRWCEKCGQRERCMSYVMGKKLEERGGFNLEEEAGHDGEGLWARLREVFESTYEVLHELAKERGVDVKDIYTSENIDKEFWGEDYENAGELLQESGDVYVEESDIIRVCAIYENFADRCLEELFGEQAGLKDDAGSEEALEIVNWYQDLIQSKMRRALYGYRRSQSGQKERENDFNGSAKVALIAVDHSLAGWKQIGSDHPDCGREIVHLTVMLEQLKTDIERQFPSAREFRRPGFEIPVPLHS